MLLRNLIGGALGGAALAVLAAAPMALAADTGTFTLSCLANDSALQTSEGITDATVAPAHVSVSPASLWPPNHKMRDLTVSMGLTQDSSSSVNVTLTINDINDDQVTADDPGGSGCGRSTAKQGADWAPTDFSNNAVQVGGPLEHATDSVGFAAGAIQVRGERCGKVGTRTYSIDVTCCDTTNNVCDSSPETLEVTVPKSRKHHGQP
jgi:hypothetical protein